MPNVTPSGNDGFIANTKTKEHDTLLAVRLPRYAVVNVTYITTFLTFTTV